MGSGEPPAGKARTAVHLYYAEGYSTEEISHLMHIPAATVRTRLHRALQAAERTSGRY
ncbi:MAG: RNA polymerase sigma factor [Dysosmobacter sp.]